MLKKVVFHLGTAGDALSTHWAWAEGRSFLMQQGVIHPNPPIGFGFPLLDILKRRPEAQAGILPPGESFIKEYQTYLQNSVSQNSARILCIDFGNSFSWLCILPLLRSLVQHAFPQAEMLGFISLPRYDIALERQFSISLMQGEIPTSSWIKMQGESPAYLYASGLNEIFSIFGREHVACFVPEEPRSYTAKELNRPLLSSQAAFWDFAGVSIPLDETSGLACFRPKLDLHLPPEFLAFCRSCNGVRNNSNSRLTSLWANPSASPAPIYLPPPPVFLSPWTEQSVRFADWGTFFSPFSPEERAAFAANHKEDNAATAKLLGREQLFTPVDISQPHEPFTGLTREGAFRVAERLDRDFACTLMADFAAAPIQYLTREQHLCRQALHDVLDPPSTIALPYIGRSPTVSVLTLTHNHASYVVDCIESVIAQKTEFPIQHIIADDCSDDGTQDIILDYAAKYPHIVPVFQKKRSFGRQNVAALLNMARTEYVAICEGDDYFTDPNKLQMQVDFLNSNPDCALCFHVARVKYENDPAKERLYPELDTLPRGVRSFYSLTDLIRHNFMQTNTVMYRWRFKNGLPDWFRTDLTPGDWYWHLLHAETGKIGFINKIMSVYRRHEKAAYYLAEVDRLQHRANVGMREIAFYDAVNKHFNRKFEPIILDMVNGIFADAALYDEKQDENEGTEPMLYKLADKYPDFARHFLRSLDFDDLPK